MELKEFIKLSLLEICGAIKESNEELKKEQINATVNPFGVQVNSQNSQAYARYSANPEHADLRVVHKVDFDVSVVSQVDSTKDCGAKISIASIGIGAGKENKEKNKSETRLQFSIPVAYPEGR